MSDDYKELFDFISKKIIPMFPQIQSFIIYKSKIIDNLEVEIIFRIKWGVGYEEEIELNNIIKHTILEKFNDLNFILIFNRY